MTAESESVKNYAKEQEALSGKRILLVEDDPRIRTVITMVLTRLGAQALAVVDGVEAIEVLHKQYRRKEPVQYAVVDLMLPRMNGVGFLRYVRDNENFTNLPVLVVSGASDERDLHECRCLGIDAFIPKPVTLSLFVSTLVRAIRSRGEKLIEESGLTPEAPTFSSLGYPLEFGGFPMPKKYPLRAAFYRCPFCGQTFTAPRLCNRALKPDYNDRLAIGLYSEGMEKDFVEYSLIDIVICPECLYTADRIGFHRIWTRGENSLESVIAIPTKRWEPVYFQVTGKVKLQMMQQIYKRKETVAKAGDGGMSLFTLSMAEPEIPRTFGDALLALDLAVRCTELLFEYYNGEPEARLRHKTAGYMLKRFHIMGLIQKRESDERRVQDIKQRRIRVMFECMQALLSVNDIDFNVIEERLYCITRRFFLADMLIPFIQNKEEVAKLIKIRKRCLSDMKGALIRARQAKSTECKVIERFMLPLENRMYEIQKKEEELRSRMQPGA